MSITSIQFFVLATVVVILYYALPKRAQWMVLLGASCLFYCAGGLRSFFFVLATAATTYGACLLMERSLTRQKAFLKEHKAELSKEEKKQLKHRGLLRRRWIMAAALVINFGILCTFKYLNFLIGQFNHLLNAVGSGGQIDFTLSLLIPLGVSFYTFQTMGYLVDVYWEKVTPEHNFFKLLLFVSFFPQMTQGPISDFSQLAPQLFGAHTFTYHNYSYGCQRMLWGFFKKIALADVLAPYVQDVFANYASYSGITVLIGALMYSVEIYADFSGYMDIVCGYCQILDIKLAENFERPYFSKSIAEYWRRWHITLGAWFKKYIYYPIAVAKWNRNLEKKARHVVGQHISRSLCASIALVVTWLATGLWHGASWAYIAWGGVNGLFIILSLWLEPVYAQCKTALHIRENCWLWRAFQTVRTFALVTFIKVLPEVGSLSDGVGFWRRVFTDHTLPRTLATLLPNFQSGRETLLIVFGVALLFVASLLQRKQSLRDRLAKAPGPLRWALFALLAVLTIMRYFGNTTEGFMYEQF